MMTMKVRSPLTTAAADHRHQLQLRSCALAALIWTSIITGCWSAGLRAARSPGVTTPHFVTSNGLGDRIHPPLRPSTSSGSPDYDSLLAKVNGDFGIKSAIVKAAGEEPEYRGAETLVVPLYIPEGAVPIRLARIPRSGGPGATGSHAVSFSSSGRHAASFSSSGSSGGSLRLPSARRSRLPSVTSRRQGGPRRSSNPTSAPSFLRGWGRRIAPRADSRVGLHHDDAQASASHSHETNVSGGVKSTKRNQLSRGAHLPDKPVDTDKDFPVPASTRSGSITSSPATTTSKETTSRATSIKAITTTTATTRPAEAISTSTTSRPVAISSPSSNISERTNSFVSKSSVNAIEKVTLTVTTESSPSSNSTARIPILNVRTVSTAKPTLRTSSTKPTVVQSSESSNNPSKTSRNGDRRPMPLPRPVQDILGHSSRISRTSTTAAPTDEEVEEVNPEAKINDHKSNGPRISLLARSRISQSRSAAGSPEETIRENRHVSNQPSDTSSSNSISKRRLPFPPRPSTTGRTSSEKVDEPVNIPSTTVQSPTTTTSSSKFRLPLLNRKAINRNVGGPSQSHQNSNEDKSPISSTPEVLLGKGQFTTENPNNKSLVSPSLSVPIPIRRRRPLRTRLPLSETSNPVPNFSSLTTIPTTIAPRKTTTRSTTTRSTTTGSTTTKSTTTTTRRPTSTPTPATTKTSTTLPTTTDLPETDSSPSTTTTSTIRRIHEFFKISPNRKNVHAATPAPKEITSRRTTERTTDANIPLTTTEPSSIFPSTHTWHKPLSTQRTKTSSQESKSSAETTTAPTNKSAADIVLASLSEVMRDATSGDKDKFREIASDLDTLNKQLAERGILIIHAEIDGKIIKLRNHTKASNSTLGEPFDKPGAYDGDRSNLNENEQETLQSHSLSSTDDSITTIFTPSDKLEYDLVMKNDDDLGGNGFSSTFYKVPKESGVTDKQNEVSTTKLSRISGYTTSKPNTKGASIISSSESVAQDRRNNANRQNQRLLGRLSNSSLITTRKSPMNSDNDDSQDKTNISATSTKPGTVTTRTRTTSIPVSNSGIKKVKYSFEVEYPTSESSITSSETTSRESNEEVSFIKPSSHLRPEISGETGVEEPSATAEVILEPSPTNRSSHSKNPGDDEGKKLFVIEEIIMKDNEIGDLSASSSEDDPTKTHSSSTSDDDGSSVYLVGMVGIFPLAGVAAFIVRRFLRGEPHRKALPESEERPDGFTPPTHHHPRSQSLLPPLPEPKLVSHNSGGSSSSGVSSSDGGPSCKGGLPSTLHSPSPWEFSRSKLRLVSVLGEGNFGVVWQAEARGFCDYAAGASTVLVAVKKVKENAGAKEKCDLLRELSVMQLLGPHPNVVSLLGCCTQTEPHLVIMEYVMFGKLLTFLRDHRTRHNYFNFSSDTAALTARDLTRFASQVATGCDYLQSRGIIHRDLAARNILVDHNKVCKIADFGMARSIQDIGSDIYEQKSKGALPIRWMAPESLYMNIFTHKSDVWSFGILCWEIVTLGATPYPGLTAREVMRQVTEGYRLERPDHCRPELYRLLATCWQQDLNKRPTFHQLKIELTTLLEHQTGYIDLENFPEEDYFSMHQNNDEKL